MGSLASRRGYTMALGLDLDYLERSARGGFDLGWLRDTSSEWGVRAKPGKTGLTLSDIAIGSYSEVPDHAPPWTMGPRTSGRVVVGDGRHRLVEGEPHRRFVIQRFPTGGAGRRRRLRRGRFADHGGTSMGQDRR